MHRRRTAAFPLIRSGFRLAVALCLLSLATTSMAWADSRPLVVFAAASLKNAIDDANALYRQQSGVVVQTSYAASSALARQIEAGAPADVFISADRAWMDYLAEKHLIRSASRADLVGNELVLIAPSRSAKSVTIVRDFPLAAMLGDGRLALADPGAVPAGRYAKAALQTLGIWASVTGKLAPAENVRAALLLVARGESPLGIVYATDAAADSGVEVIGTFPADSHPPIIYPSAATASGDNPATAGYLAFLRSPAAAPAFTRQGFTLLAK